MKHFWSALTLIVFVMPQAVQAQETRQYFRDWLAVCRPDGYCSALAYDNTDTTAGVDADYILRVGRQPQDLYWQISFTAVAAMPGEFPEFDVTVDQTPFTFSRPTDVGAYGAINDFFFLNAPAQDLFDAMGPGNTMRVSFQDEHGMVQTASFSLSGLTAALLWIDEQQVRVGAERVAGAAPEDLTPVSADQPANVPAELLRRFAADDDCEPFEVLPHANDIIQADTENGALYFLPCTAGAYNFSYKVWKQSNGYYSPVLFAEYTQTLGWTGTSFIINPDYDAENGILTAFYKGRGIGDCGSFARWQWTGQNFKMLEYAYKDECDAEGGIETFPVMFSAKSGSGG